MKIGFTGTRLGMTDAQHKKLAYQLMYVVGNAPHEFRHGGCQGADVQAARTIRNCYDLGMVRIVCHPGPEGDSFQESSGVDDEELPGKTHFARNRDIVDASDLVVGCPGVATWNERGGTFYTMKYAIKKGKPLVIVWPNGEVEKR